MPGARTNLSPSYDSQNVFRQYQMSLGGGAQFFPHPQFNHCSSGAHQTLGSPSLRSLREKCGRTKSKSRHQLYLSHSPASSPVRSRKQEGVIWSPAGLKGVIRDLASWPAFIKRGNTVKACLGWRERRHCCSLRLWVAAQMIC